MVDLVVFEPIVIKSYRGPYQVDFCENIAALFDRSLIENSHFIIDRNIAKLYSKVLKDVLASESVLLIDATEENKSLERFPGYVSHLVNNGLRRQHRLVAIGGGITQDITCFLAATILRGVDWWFYPTTLLSQADSCIGSKSSVNSGNVKNILGTFTPPKQIFIHPGFLDTLSKADIYSGIGEIIKVHAIDGVDSCRQLAQDYQQLFDNADTMQHYIRQALLIKQSIIEQDEFDRGVRNVMNYGHTFGHAIESATEYAIPHGIAVTVGMDMANFIAYRLGKAAEAFFESMHSVLKRNYHLFKNTPIPIDAFINAIGKDKKNKGKSQLCLILPNCDGKLSRVYIENDCKFRGLVVEYLAKERN